MPCPISFLALISPFLVLLMLYLASPVLAPWRHESPKQLQAEGAPHWCGKLTLNPAPRYGWESCLQDRPREAAHSGPELTIVLALGEQNQGENPGCNFAKRWLARVKSFLAELCHGQEGSNREASPPLCRNGLRAAWDPAASPVAYPPGICVRQFPKKEHGEKASLSPPVLRTGVGSLFLSSRMRLCPTKEF